MIQQCAIKWTDTVGHGYGGNLRWILQIFSYGPLGCADVCHCPQTFACHNVRRMVDDEVDLAAQFNAIPSGRIPVLLRLARPYSTTRRTLPEFIHPPHLREPTDLATPSTPA